MDYLEREQNYVAEYRARATFLIEYGCIGSPELMMRCKQPPRQVCSHLIELATFY